MNGTDFFENVIYMRLRNGETMMGVVEEEDDSQFKLTAVMNVDSVERAEYLGIAIIPAIPFGIGQQITILKSDVLFSVEPPETLAEFYENRTEEAVGMLMEYLEKKQTIKKNKEKLLH